MLLGLGAVLVPVIIHLIRRHRSRQVNWGAMQFLMETAVHRNRRMLLEEVLLLVVRCLLIAFLALALALPFSPPGSSVPWQFVLPAVLLGVAALGTAAALDRYRRWRLGLFGVGAFLLVCAAGAAMMEQWRGTELLAKPSGAQDVAIVIDGSDSMSLAVDGVTNFERALAEARVVAGSLRHGDAASVIVAGARPLVLAPSPSGRFDELQQLLSEAVLGGGRMSANDALAAAVQTLARGDNVAKKIVFITDGQSASWKEDEKLDWERIAATFQGLAVQPTLVLRRLPMPERIENVQVAQVDVPGTVLGPERAVPIAVRIANTGTEPIREAFQVELDIGSGANVLRETMAALAPGVSETVTFHHRFGRGGSYALEARAVVRDDLSFDNRAARVVQIHERLPVLLIDGNPATRPSDRAAWFLDVALAPEASDAAPAAARSAGGANPRGPIRQAGLFAVTTVDLPKIDTLGDWRAYRVVVLANVAKLPTKVAIELANFVADGGGLLVALGSNSQADFYNHWQTLRGLTVMPARLSERRIANAGAPPARPALDTFASSVLSALADPAQSDLGSAAVTAYWRLKPDAEDANVRVFGTLDSGDPLVVERRLGQGRVLATAVSLDNRGSNLPALQAFLPLVHELVGSLMQLPKNEPKVDPAVTESCLAVLSDNEVAAASQHVPLVAAASLDVVLAALSGTAGGYRLWKFLALAAFVLAIAEIALARWIAAGRKVGNMPDVEFVSVNSDPAALRTRALEWFASSS